MSIPANDHHGGRTPPGGMAIIQQRPLSEILIPGMALSASDVAEIKEGLARRDTWIEHYRDRAGIAEEAVRSARTHLREVMASLRAPIVGYGLQDGAISGLYHDGWVGPRLELAIRPKRPVSRVTLHGWVSDDMPGGGRLTLRAGDATVAQDIVSGTFTMSVAVRAGTDGPLAIEVGSSIWTMPEGPSGRQLAFVLREIELSH